MTEPERPKRPNLKLARCESAVTTAEAAVDVVMPDGLSPTRAITTLMADGWISPSAEAYLESITSQGTKVQTGFDDAVTDLQAAVTRESADPMVEHDDPRGDIAVYPAAPTSGRPYPNGPI